MSENIQTLPQAAVKQDFSGPRNPEGVHVQIPYETALSSASSMTTFDKKVEVSEIERGIWVDHAKDELDEKDLPKPLRNLRHIVFNVYRRLFTLVFVINMALFITFLVKGGMQVSPGRIALIALGNLFAATIIRSDHFVNVLYFFALSVPNSWPLFIRRSAAKVYANGGVHTGSGISGTIWFILFLGQATKEFAHGAKISVATLTVSYIILAILLTMIVFAWPSMRAKLHNSFEHTHRFMGWTAVGLLWAQIVLLTKDTKAAEIPLRKALVHNPALWLAAVMTASIAASWSRLRKVNVRSEVLSDHAVRLYMDYVTPAPGTYSRISFDPLFEWHSFATLGEPGKTGFSLVVSRAGDWTSNIIANPPTKIWVRGIPTAGVLAIVPLFRRLVIVATGSGIGPCAPHILLHTVPIRVFWSAPNVRKTFGDKLVDSIIDADPEAVIYDTRVHGKPDMLKLTLRIVKDFDAEAVIIISNPTLTKKVVYGLEARSIPAFGAIWDS